MLLWTEPNSLGEVVDKHIEFEFDREDVDATMTTMTEDPYVHHIPTLTGRSGYDGVYSFYKNHFVGKVPSDFRIANIPVLYWDQASVLVQGLLKQKKCR